MLCEHCQEREAVINITQVIDQEKKILNLCTDCAQKLGMDSPLFDISKVFGKLIASILGEYLQTQKDTVNIKNNSKRCEYCHLSWNEFEDNSLLGCPECYHVFHDELKVLLRRLHGNNRHVGKKMPAYSNSEIFQKPDLFHLQKKLKHAIQIENFEKAAQLRDQIKEIKEKLSLN